MIDNNLNLAICCVKVNCQIRKFKITKLKQQVMPTYCHTDSTDVIENDYNIINVKKNRALLGGRVYTYRCPRVAKKLYNSFIIKDINFFFFLYDSYTSTAHSENIAVYIQGVPIL
jgi:hypothetical protein